MASALKMEPAESSTPGIQIQAREAAEVTQTYLWERRRQAGMVQMVQTPPPHLRASEVRMLLKPSSHSLPISFLPLRLFFLLSEEGFLFSSLLLKLYWVSYC